MIISLQVLSNIVRQPQPSPQTYPAPVSQQQQQPQYDEDMGYRTMTREDAAIIQERRISSTIMSPQQQTSPMTPQNNNVPSAAPALPVVNTAIAPSPISPPTGTIQSTSLQSLFYVEINLSFMFVQALL